jgi:hypothetical protein
VAGSTGVPASDGGDGVQVPVDLPACRETASNEVMFIGTVESISPNFHDQCV